MASFLSTLHDAGYRGVSSVESGALGGAAHLINFKLHDAGYRGESSVESGALGGAAHLINFKASDTVAGTSLLRKYYHLKTVGGISSRSSEHSTVITWGKEREVDSHRHLLQTYPEGDVGCVCDSYDIWRCLEEDWCGELRDLVLQRGSKGGCIYLRPDSGDPKVVILKCLEILGKTYGTETNTKGYKMLPPYLRITCSEGITHKALWSTLEHLKNHNWSTANTYFGAGAALLQKINRDTQKCAYKVSYVEVGGQGVDVYKQPVTDSGKNSKRGRLSLHHHHHGLYTTQQAGKGDSTKVRVYMNIYLAAGSTLEHLKNHNWSTANTYFGAGAALLQKINRDTQKCAYKVSYVEVGGQGVDVYKQPVTDSGKNSKRGRLSLHHHHHGLYTTQQAGKGDSTKDLLVPVFENGELLMDYTLQDIQERAQTVPNDFDVIRFLEEDRGY
ncbi:nicotinamide phosphoribosyltransferase-like [Procambarus clarkii]|uniref:nicotinamide phosphoribosyltransferase-like n=1 Tax=Procambarus clarkii TaxID=6728 RepID=UPI003743616B